MKHAYFIVSEEFKEQHNGKQKKDKKGHPVKQMNIVKDKKNRNVLSINEANDFTELFDGMNLDVVELDSEFDFNQPEDIV